MALASLFRLIPALKLPLSDWVEEEPELEPFWFWAREADGLAKMIAIANASAVAMDKF